MISSVGTYTIIAGTKKPSVYKYVDKQASY